MDREIAPGIRRRTALRRFGMAAAALLAVGALGAATVEWLRPSIARRDIETARVSRGVVEATVQANGIVVPASEQVVSSPVEARVLQVHRRAGDTIEAGDELLTLDTSAARLALERLNEKLAQTESERARLRLQVDESVAGLRAELEQRKLDAEILRLKAEQSARLLAEGLTTSQEALLDQTAVRKIEIEIRELEEKIARAVRSGDAQIAAAALDASIVRKDREESRRQLELAMMRAGRAGVLTAIVDEVGATVRSGDVLARIADLSTFRIVATVSDLYVPRLVAGMPARVRVDERTSVNGTLSSIDPRIEKGVARVHVALESAAHAKLRNNLRVDVFVVTGGSRGVPQLRRGALGRSTAEEVFVVRDERLVRVPVRWGAIGEDNLEVIEGLVEGDEVVISDMSDYEGLKEIRLR